VATEIVKLLRDDLDGSTAARTVSFSWDGANYEIDLSKKNIAELDAILQTYISSGRRTSGRARGASRAKRASRPSAGVDLAAVRTWAAANGHAVAERGRVSAAVLDAFHADADVSTPARVKKAAPRAKKAAPRKRAAAS
jgi:Lsr2